MGRPRRDEVAILLHLYDIYDMHRESLLWFLHEFDAKSYAQYKVRYPGFSKERAHFTAVCGFFELSGVFVKRGALDAGLYFDVFNPHPYWARARPTIEGMRKERPHVYENFEFLAKRRARWARTRGRRP